MSLDPKLWQRESRVTGVEPIPDQHSFSHYTRSTSRTIAFCFIHHVLDHTKVDLAKASVSRPCPVTPWALCWSANIPTDLGGGSQTARILALSSDE